MSNHQLINFYQHELAYIQRLLAEFAEKNPKIAGRLRISATTVEDPQVRRLIENFAFLNAKLQHKLSDNFPEIGYALLDIIAPHFLAPIPALSIIQFKPNRQLQLVKKRLNKHTLLKAEAKDGSVCYFRTCYPVEVLPIEINAANLNGLPLQAPALVKQFNPATKIAATLRLSLNCIKPTLKWQDLLINELRFYINHNAKQAYALYELLMQHTAVISLADSATDPAPVFLEASCLQPVGFAAEEGLLPYSARVKTGHRLLMDYAILPEKFLFFDLKQLGEKIQQKFTQPGGKLEIFFYLKQHNEEVEKILNADYFALGCTPIINLFTQSAKVIYPIARQQEYPLLIAGEQARLTHEIYAVEQVTARQEDLTKLNCVPFNSVRHGSNNAGTIYYHTRRAPAWQAGIYDEEGTEILLSFSDQKLQPIDLSGWQVEVQALATNRQLPNQLAFAPGNFSLSFEMPKEDLIQDIVCLVPFTPVRRPFLQADACWRYISHLSPNHLSLSPDEEGIAAFCNILRIYQLEEVASKQDITNGLLNINWRRVAARNPSARYGNPMWNGTEINLNINEHYFEKTSLYLFGCILQHLFPLYCTNNSFTQLVISIQNNKIFYCWPPQVGQQSLI